jgi:drug/metabolite transporter (DMT)-like permease
MPILESLGYVFVPLLSYVFLKERISRRMVVSILLILAGIYVFYQ